MSANTLPKILHPLMNAPSIRLSRCAICGCFEPLEQHHIVRRGAGKLFIGGHEVKKPTITLCGFGNNLRDANGRYLCHGLAHYNMLHFRWVSKETVEGNFGNYCRMNGGVGGHLEYLLLDKPTPYLQALSMDGWKPLRMWR